MESFGSEEGPMGAVMYTVMNCWLPSISENLNV
jgi:hypothetical protein